jgi:hypothetical protein
LRPGGKKRVYEQHYGLFFSTKNIMGKVTEQIAGNTEMFVVSKLGMAFYVP